MLTRVDGGWFGGTVIRSGAGVKDKKEVPGATHVVEYKRNGAPASLRVPSDLVGKKGAVLTTKSYGAAQTWLLLEPAPPFQG